MGLFLVCDDGEPLYILVVRGKESRIPIAGGLGRENLERKIECATASVQNSQPGHIRNLLFHSVIFAPLRLCKKRILDTKTLEKLAKYEVKEAKKQEDGSYIVTVVV